MVDPIPSDYPRVTPYICVDGCADAIDFYVEVFDGSERMRIPMPGGLIGHAEIAVGDGLIMLSDPAPEMGILDPKVVGGTATTISVYVDDCDAAMARAIENGATQVREVENHFYGDRSGMFLDPWGHRWSVSTHVEDVSPEEMARRSEELFVS